MELRNLTMLDVLYVLKNGLVFEPGQPTKNPVWFKYRVESRTPNSGNREVAVIVIPQPTPAVKLITVMWADEKMTAGGG